MADITIRGLPEISTNLIPFCLLQSAESANRTRFHGNN